MNVMRYMQSHCVEDVASVGYNGCSGVREMAVEQFRMDEAKYRASHPKRKQQTTKISVLDYLESNHKGKLPKHLKAEAPADGEFEMTLQHAQRLWRNAERSEEERAAAREVLKAHTLTITKTETLAEHLIVSLHPTDNPTQEQMQGVVDDFLRHEIFAGHKMISNIHWNEDHKHAHVLVNNFDEQGASKLSLSGTKLRELRRHLDRVCYKYGFSIVDSKEARLDPEHAKWIDQVKAEGRVKVWPEKEARAATNWKAHHDRKIDAAEKRIEQNPKLLPYTKELNKDLVRNDLFIGAPGILDMTVRSMTLQEMEKLATEEARRRKQEASSKKRRDAEEEQWRRVYCVRVYIYDRNYHRYRHRTLLELIFELAKIILLNESKFLYDNYPSRYDNFTSALDSPINHRIQNILDAGKTANDLNARTPRELKGRVDEIGAAIGDTRRAISYDKRTIQQSQELYDAVLTWQDESRPEEERKSAYAILASNKLTTPAKMQDLKSRYERAKRRLPENEEHLQNLNRDYRNAKKAYETLEVVNVHCREVNSVAYEASKLKPDRKSVV